MADEVARIEEKGKLKRETVVLTPEFKAQLESYKPSDEFKVSQQGYLDRVKEFEDFLEDQRDRYLGVKDQFERYWDTKFGGEKSDYIGERALAINREIDEILESNLGSIDFHMNRSDSDFYLNVQSRLSKTEGEIARKVDESLARLTSPVAIEIIKAADATQIGEMGSNYPEMLVKILLYSPDDLSEVAKQLRDDSPHYSDLHIDMKKLENYYDKLKQKGVLVAAL